MVCKSARVMIARYRQYSDSGEDYWDPERAFKALETELNTALCRGSVNGIMRAIELARERLLLDHDDKYDNELDDRLAFIHSDAVTALLYGEFDYSLAVGAHIGNVGKPVCFVWSRW